MGARRCWVLKSSNMRRQGAVKDREEEERKQKVTYIVCGYDRGEMEEAVKDKKSSGKVQTKNDKRG